MDWDALKCAVDDFRNAFEAVWRVRMIAEKKPRAEASGAAVAQ